MAVTQALPGPVTPLAVPKDQSSSTYHTVMEVRSILLARLPYELVDIILIAAQYFAVLSMKRVYHLRIQASKEPIHNAKWLYMISDPIPEMYNGDRIVHTTVQHVTFRVRSCDQGWGGFSQDKNTYRNSYTWFETSILRPDQPSDPSPHILNEATSHPINFHSSILPPPSSSELESWTEILSPYKRRNKRWLVQMNAQASRHIRYHTIKWSRDHSNDPEVFGQGGEVVEYDARSGSGRGLGFVETLNGGDRIAFVARALYPGWENNVYEAEIEIAYQT